MKKKRDFQRIYLVHIVFILLFSGLLAKIFYLQIVRKSTFKSLASGQHATVIPLKGARGRILDRNGRILATDINGYSVYADPKFIEDIPRSARLISSLLDIPQDSVREKLNRKKRFVWLKRKVPPDIKMRLEAEGIKGIAFIKEDRRFYPQGTLAAHVLGGVSIDNSGIEGIEYYYNRYLKGKDGLVSVLRDSASTYLYLSPQILRPQKGADIVLTIDAQIQYWTERYLSEIIEEYRARAGSVVVMNAANGEILALANFPSFDPNDIHSVNADVLRNMAVTDTFEPGSVFKIVTLEGALEEELYRSHKTVYCENGQFKIPGAVLHDWHPYGTLTFSEVFKKSSNIGVAKIATSLSPGSFFGHIKQLGFGKKTGVDLPGEVAGLLKFPRDWSKTTRYIIPIGQEVGVTVLQLANAMCILANGGYRVRPHITEKIEGPYGFSNVIDPARHRVVDYAVSVLAKRILTGVVEDGTGKRARIKGVTVGGKTGTAQKFDTAIGGYSKSAYRASFVGFIEKEAECVVIAVSVDEPRRSHFGGVVAAPLFKKIAEKVADYRFQEQEKIQAATSAL